MRILSEVEGKSWLRAAHLDPDEHGWLKAIGDSISFLCPADTGRKTALSKLLAELVGTGSESAIWITAHGVFPSSENLNLFYGYRK